MIRRFLERLTAPRTDPQPEQLTALAAAALLLEVSWADQDISEVEEALILGVLQTQWQLDPDDARQIFERSRAAQDQSVGLYEYTRTINAAWSEPEKFRLLVALWQLALADAVVDRYEEHTIRRIAELLYVGHERFIEAKLMARHGA